MIFPFLDDNDDIDDHTQQDAPSSADLQGPDIEARLVEILRNNEYENGKDELENLNHHILESNSLSSIITSNESSRRVRRRTDFLSRKLKMFI